jgi:hypothetical protein
MAAKTKQAYSPIVQAIIDGTHDEELTEIQRVAAWRLKNLWRPRMRVRLEGTKNPELEGKEGVITKVNQKTISVGLGKATTDQWGTSYEFGDWNVSPSLLRKVEA